MCTYFEIALDDQDKSWALARGRTLKTVDQETEKKDCIRYSNCMETALKSH